MGATPHRWAKAASPRSRSGCWPAVTSSWPAWSLPIASSLEEPGSGPTDEGGQPLVSQLELGLEQLNAVGDWLQRCLAGVGWVGQESLVGSEPGAGGDQHRHREVLERLADRGWCGNQERLELVNRRGPSFAGAPAGGAQHANRLDDPIASLGGRGRRSRQHGPGGRLGVDRVRLAMLPAGAPVGPVDLDHPHLLIKQVASQAGAVAAGALHADHTDVSVAAKPAQ